MEDRILRDSQKTQRLANDLKKRTQDYNQILTEVNILKLFFSFSTKFIIIVRTITNTRT